MNGRGLLIMEMISLLDTVAGRLFELILVDQCLFGSMRSPYEMTSPYGGSLTSSEGMCTTLSDLFRVNKGSLSMFIGGVRPAKTNATL